MKKTLYIVQGFNKNGRIIDSKVCKSKEEADREAERLSRKGAFFINIQATDLGAY